MRNVRAGGLAPRCKLRGPVVATTLAALVATGAAGCGNGEKTTAGGDPTGSHVRGLATVSGDKQVIFLGYRKDLKAELQDSLSGVQTDERWYRIELPRSKMPTSAGVAQLDFAKDADIRVYRRGPFYGFSPPLYSTVHWDSKRKGFSGGVKISGAQVVANAKGLAPDSSRWGVELYINFKGYVDIPGIKNDAYFGTEENIGALFALPQSTP